MPAVCFRTTDSPRNTLPRPSPRKTPMKRTAQTANGTTGSRNNRKSVAAPRQTDDGDEQATPRASTFDVRGKDGAGDDAHSNVVESEPTSMTSSLVIEGDNFNNAAQSFTEPLTSQSTLPRTLERLSKAKRVRFYRNGDQYYKGQWYPLSDRMKSMKPLMEDLTKTMCDSVALPHGIMHIFTIDGANRITDIDQFEDGESYVCSSSDVFKSLDYANAREPFWCLATTSNRGGRFGQTDNGPAPLNVSAEPSNEPRDFVYPRIITVIRNGNKPRRVVRHLLNKKTARRGF
ncbi:hypothetical protein WR25_20295 [Diploscapter pachys]|uniref:Doublecortin domain-containing protein n=1 Tax=Diploscapter pachys TaxID=2018661 RepID=A0A2A2LP72_9BILA|nr:hypothetical protein WR25_20295 [Diploscapter pachys]